MRSYAMREGLLFVLLLAAGVLVSIGVFLVAVPAGFIVAGALLAGLSVLTLTGPAAVES